MLKQRSPSVPHTFPPAPAPRSLLPARPPAPGACSFRRRQSRRCRARTRTCGGTHRGVQLLYHSSQTGATDAALGPAAMQPQIQHIHAGGSQSKAVIRTTNALAPSPCPHSLKRSVRQGMTRARCAMMDMRCSEGWRLNSTTSPSGAAGWSGVQGEVGSELGEIHANRTALPATQTPIRQPATPASATSQFCPSCRPCWPFLPPLLPTHGPGAAPQCRQSSAPRRCAGGRQT